MDSTNENTLSSSEKHGRSWADLAAQAVTIHHGGATPGPQARGAQAKPTDGPRFCTVDGALFTTDATGARRFRDMALEFTDMREARDAAVAGQDALREQLYAERVELADLHDRIRVLRAVFRADTLAAEQRAEAAEEMLAKMEGARDSVLLRAQSAEQDLHGLRRRLGDLAAETSPICPF